MTSVMPIQDHKSLYRQFLAGMYDAVLITDPNGHLIEINPRMTEYFQYESEMVWDKPIAMFIPGITAAVVQRIRKGVGDDARHVMLDAMCLRKDGTSFAAEVSVSMIDLIDTGDLVFTVRNIDRRRKLLTMMNSKINAYENAQSACFVCDAGRQFRYVNRAFLQMFDLADESEVVGHTFESLMADEPLPALFAKALEGESVAYRITAESDSDDAVELEIQMEPDLQNKKIVGVVGSVLQIGA